MRGAASVAATVGFHFAGSIVTTQNPELQNWPLTILKPKWQVRPQVSDEEKSKDTHPSTICPAKIPRIQKKEKKTHNKKQQRKKPTQTRQGLQTTRWQSAWPSHFPPIVAVFSCPIPRFQSLPICCSPLAL